MNGTRGDRDDSVARLRRHLRREHHGGPGLHRGHHAAGAAFEKDGLIGMAFGLGFIFGPVLPWCRKVFSAHRAGLGGERIVPGELSRGLRAPAESRQPGSAPAASAPDSPVEHVLQPNVGLLVLIFFLATFCFTCFETTLGLMVGKNFGLDHDASPKANGTALFASVVSWAPSCKAGPLGGS